MCLLRRCRGMGREVFFLLVVFFWWVVVVADVGVRAGVYTHWFRLDPMFPIRTIFHLWHPNSPLSHPALLRRVFFGEGQTDDYVQRFFEKASPYESYLWVFGMARTFVNPQRVLGQISSWGKSGQSVMILRGEVDKIMP